MSAFFIDDDGNLIISGGIFGITEIAIPNGTITNAMVNATAAIAASKCQRGPCLPFWQVGTPTTHTINLRHVEGTAGTLKKFSCSIQTPPTGASTVTVDLRVNGVSVLVAAITFNSSSVANQQYSGTISSSALADGDRISVVITATQDGTSSVGSDLGGCLDLDEDYKT